MILHFIQGGEERQGRGAFFELGKLVVVVRVELTVFWQYSSRYSSGFSGFASGSSGFCGSMRSATYARIFLARSMRLAFRREELLLVARLEQRDLG